MSTHIDTFIPGTPVSQPRPRATIRGRHAGIYNPKTADAWKAQIVTCIRPCLSAVIEGPLKVVMVFRLPRPKGHYRTGRNAGKMKENAPLWHEKKPDFDNLVKASMDAITNAGAWRDDSQVALALVCKVYVAPNESGMQLIISDAPASVPHL